MTNAEKKDLRQAWTHMHNAGELLEKMLPRADDVTKARIWEARKELSDARRLIDRVEQGRSY